MANGCIAGVMVTPLKRIEHPKGDIYHAMKASSDGYDAFGEAYFSSIYKDDIKGWKKHTQMTLNLIVPVGAIRFIIYDDRETSLSKGQYLEMILSATNYHRLTIKPGLWLAFQGVGSDLNLLLNIASIEHDPEEAINLPLEAIPLGK